MEILSTSEVGDTLRVETSDGHVFNGEVTDKQSRNNDSKFAKVTDYKLTLETHSYEIRIGWKYEFEPQTREYPGYDHYTDFHVEGDHIDGTVEIESVETFDPEKYDEFEVDFTQDIDSLREEIDRMRPGDGIEIEYDSRFTDVPVTTKSGEIDDVDFAPDGRVFDVYVDVGETFDDGEKRILRFSTGQSTPELVSSVKSYRRLGQIQRIRVQPYDDRDPKEGR